MSMSRYQVSGVMECGCRECGGSTGKTVPESGPLPLCGECSTKHRLANRAAWEADKLKRMPLQARRLFPRAMANPETYADANACGFDGGDGIG